jgi:hypothetical protein
MRRMLLLAWNIRQGGGSRLARIADALARQDADILVLSEYRGGEAATRLLAAMDTLGYRHVTKLAPPPNRNGVLIASRCAFREHGAIGYGLPEPYRMVSAEFASFRLSGVCMPNLLAKVPLLGGADRCPQAREQRAHLGNRRFQHLSSIPRRGVRDRPDRPLHGQDRTDRVLRFVAPPLSGGSRIFVVQYQG